jgi:ABC-2 type transport system ATP-binding protein
MLEVRELTKRYSSIPVVDGVSFVAKPFEVTGYLGPNGSGKTTTVKMLTGLLQPTRGHIFFDGQDIRDHLIEYKRRLGYVPEEPDLYSYLTGQEYLQLIGRLRCMQSKILEEKIEHLLRLFSLRAYRHSAISSYSKGMRQKILLSAALLHNPDILILDEPDSGLDVTSGLIFRSLAKSLADEGKIVLYSSHVLDVVEKVCSRVVVLYKGRVVANDSVDRLRDLMKLPSLETIFAQLVLQEDTEKVAKNIVEVMKL